LQNGRDTNPCEIGDIGERNPFDMRIDSDECPDECSEDEEDIYRREEVVFETELEIGKGEVEHEVEDKRQSDYCGNFFRIDFVKHRAIGDSDDRIKHRPDRPKDPARWCPGWFD